MTVRKYLIQTTVLAVLLGACISAWAEEETALGSIETLVPDRPWEAIDVALALDTSGSMELLIEAARVKLWEIVHDLTLLEPTPTLRVALLTFGNSENARESGWVKIEADLTENLDLVSERLFELTSKGGTEYIGRVLKTSLQGLSWTPSEEALKLLFVAGNEPANQDPEVALEDMTDVAREAGISLHVIFCGQAESEDAETWKELAELAEGRFAAIDHRTAPVAVKTPFDAELAALGSAINKTYVPLGEEGQKRRQKLEEQDEKVRKLSLAAAFREAAAHARRSHDGQPPSRSRSGIP